MKSYTETNSFKPSCPEFRSRYCYDLCNWFGVCTDFEAELEAYNEEMKNKTMKDIKPGMTVMLCLKKVKDIPRELRELDERIYRVKSVTAVSQNWRYYELYGCKSKAGVPWCIDEDWIEPVREFKR